MRERELRHTYRLFGLLIVAWTLFASLALLWNIYHQENQYRDIARSQARIAFQKDLIYRYWATRHGGVYVPITEKTPPNPYLANLKERDITTPSGRRLTLINPAYMTRQVYTMSGEQGGPRARLTSLRPINPENRPDDWERAALQSFEQGTNEVTTFMKKDGKTYLRLIRPLVTQKACLKCHARQGYIVGDIRGGLSFTVAVDPLIRVINSQLLLESLAICSLWVIGILGILLLGRKQRQRVLEHIDTIEELEKSNHLLVRVKNSLQESEGRFRTLANIAPAGIYLTDSEGHYVYANRRWLEMAGLNQEEALGRDWIRGIHPEDRKRVEADWYRMVDTEGSWEEEFRFHDGNGKTTWVYGLATPMFNDRGERSGFVGINHDITNLKRFEIELKVAKENAENANQAKSLFLANMSHELRTPLNAVIGFSQLLESSPLLARSPELSRYVNYIVDSGNHLLEMVNDILDLSKIEAGRIEIERRPFDIQALLQRSSLTVKSQAFKKKIQIEMQIDPDIGWLDGDEVRIKQVVFNLLSNAVKFTEQGKTIGLEAHGRDDEIMITVWDQGIGIAEQDRERIFESFEQVQDSRIHTMGSGLGLAISKKLIELHGGSIGVESVFGRGSRFTIILPGRLKTPVHLRSEEEQITSDISDAIPETPILFVEDNEINRHLVGETLGAHYRLDFATSGAEAIAKVRERSYGLILMDIRLSDMDGTEVLKEIRRIRTEHLPVIALTAFAMKGDDEKYRAAGFDDYLAKPMDLKTLHLKVRQALRS